MCCPHKLGQFNLGIVCIEELKKNIYYVEDPDGYEIAVVPENFHPTFAETR